MVGTNNQPGGKMLASVNPDLLPLISDKFNVPFFSSRQGVAADPWNLHKVKGTAQLNGQMDSDSFSGSTPDRPVFELDPTDEKYVSDDYIVFARLEIKYQGAITVFESQAQRVTVKSDAVNDPKRRIGDPIKVTRVDNRHITVQGWMGQNGAEDIPELQSIPNAVMQVILYYSGSSSAGTCGGAVATLQSDGSYLASDIDATSCFKQGPFGKAIMEARTPRTDGVYNIYAWEDSFPAWIGGANGPHGGFGSSGGDQDFPSGGAGGGGIMSVHSLSSQENRVIFSVDGKDGYTKTSAPFYAVVHTAALTNGVHTIAMRALDATDQIVNQYQETWLVSNQIHDGSGPLWSDPANGPTPSPAPSLSLSSKILHIHRDGTIATELWGDPTAVDSTVIAPRQLGDSTLPANPNGHMLGAFDISGLSQSTYLFASLGDASGSTARVKNSNGNITKTALYQMANNAWHLVSLTDDQTAMLSNGTYAVMSAETGDEGFGFRSLISYPNPAKNGVHPIIRFEVGMADHASIHIFDVSGKLVHQVDLGAPEIKDGVLAYEYPWDTSGVASGVYIARVHVERGGYQPQSKEFKLAIEK
jgi:hypothetical protein